MKSFKLEAPFTPFFDLIGIVSSAREYKLAWLINQQLDLNLTKQEDIYLEFLDHKVLSISNFSCETYYTTVRLLKNKTYIAPSPQLTHLLPELKEYDFFVMLQSEGETLQVEEISQHLKKIKAIDYVYPLEWEKVKSRDNLIFC